MEQTRMLPGAVTDWVFHVEQVRAAPAAKTFRYVPRGTRLTLAVATNEGHSPQNAEYGIG